MKTYDCSGPEANRWASLYHDMLMSDYYDTYQPGEPVEGLDGKPWPGSIETQRWDYDAPGMREYEAEDDMEVE